MFVMSARIGSARAERELRVGAKREWFSCRRFGIESSFDTSHLSKVIDNLHKSCFVFVLLSIYYESVCISRSLLPNMILVHVFHVNEAQKGYCFSVRIFFPGKYLN